MVAVGADGAEARRVAAEIDDAGSRSSGSVPSAAARSAISGARRPRKATRTRAGSRRWSRHAGSRRPGPASGRSRGGGRTCRNRSRSRRGSSRAPAIGAGRARRGSSVERGGDQTRAPRSADISRDRVGDRRVERVGAVREGVHRARPQVRLGRAGHRLGVGDHQRRPHQALARVSAPAGRRWMPVISAPDIVVGTAATRAPRDRGDAPWRCRSPGRRRGRPARSAPTAARAARRRASATWPGRHLVHSARRGRQVARAARAPAGARQRSKPPPKPCSSQQLRRPAATPRAEDDGAAGVAPDEVAAHPRHPSAGCTTGRRFGSTSARRCS